MSSEKVIIILLLIAILFSIGSTFINLYILNLDFKPINVKIPGPQIKGNPVGGVGLVIEGVSPTGNVVNENEVNQNAS